MEQKIQIKLAQLNLAMRHVLRNRMQKQAEASVITELKKDRDRSLLLDILGGAGKGSLYGLGAGGFGGSLLAAESSLQNNDYWREVPINGIYGGVHGGILGIPTGAILGSLYRGLTHNSRKQKAIDKLKELGVESNE